MSLISIFKTPVIEFFCDERYWGAAPLPEPAGKNIPDWFKKIPPFSKQTRDQHGKLAMNAKKCIPMIDAMTLGFTIPLAGDQHIISNEDASIVSISPTSTEFDRLVERHSAEQVANAFGAQDPIKFINPWVIKTAPGWSTLFIPPINSLENRFLCLGGLVDTDKYPKQVNFPGVWLAPNFDDFLPAGTPLVTAIPIKRSAIITEYDVHEMTLAERKEIARIERCQRTRDHYYTKELRVDK